MDTIVQNLKRYLDFKGISVSAAEKKINLSNGSLSKPFNANTTIKTDTLEKFLNSYSDLSSEWLLTGHGDMLKSEVVGVKRYTKPVGKEKELPLLPIEVMAGSGTGEFIISEHDIEEWYKIPNFKDADFLVRVTGSSMRPKYSNGDIVACKKLALHDIYFEWNRIYVLDTTQGAIIKRVKKGSDAENLLIVSDNLDYDPFELHLSKVNAVALVIGVVRLE
jgi:phage repressor protein C with HTH and peptisase S24 domain